ncbi:hypothetical protein RUM44_009110 [Polyplax serrata]|uniref:Uncharacterized protein n=1 Tax=Polyplax serrata TaxID=468196 RepID=A0ABR1ARS2_POLSC
MLFKSVLSAAKEKPKQRSLQEALAPQSKNYSSSARGLPVISTFYLGPNGPPNNQTKNFQHFQIESLKKSFPAGRKIFSGVLFSGSSDGKAVFVGQSTESDHYGTGKAFLRGNKETRKNGNPAGFSYPTAVREATRVVQGARPASLFFVPIVVVLRDYYSPIPEGRRRGNPAENNQIQWVPCRGRLRGSSGSNKGPPVTKRLLRPLLSLFSPGTTQKEN